MYRSKRSSIPSIIEVSSEIFDEDEAQTSLPLALSTPEKMNEDALCIDEKKLKTICSPVTLKDLLGKIHIHTDSMSSSKAEESLLSCSLRDNSDAVFKSVPPSNVGTSVPKMVQILETNTEEEERDELDDIDNLLLQDCIRLSELLDSQVEDLEDDKRSICSTKDPMSKESINSTPTPTPTPIPSQANSDDSITSEASNNPLGLQYIRYYQTNQDNGVALIGREVQKRLIGDRWLPGKVTGYCK